MKINIQIEYNAFLETFKQLKQFQLVVYVTMHNNISTRIIIGMNEYSNWYAREYTESGNELLGSVPHNNIH